MRTNAKGEQRVTHAPEQVEHVSADDAPTAVENFPVGQFVHDSGTEAPGAVEYLPAAHSVQVAEEVAPKVTL